MNIIVTGASRGIGYQTVLNLAVTGKHKIIAISRNETKFEKTNSEIRNLSFDLENNDFNPLFDKISDFFELKKGNFIDILINNAGYLVNKPFIETKKEDWNKIFEINVFAIAEIIRILYPFFNRKEATHIVNISSMGGVQGTEKFSGLSAYSASKGALNILTECLSKEFENENISVNSINPGSVQTKMLEDAFPGFRAVVSAQDMGKYIADFSLNAGKLMNGRIVEVSLNS